MTTNTRSFSHFKRGEKNPPKMSFNNRFPPSKNIRHRSSWGPNTVNHFQKADVPRLSPEEEDFDFYPERLHLIKSRQLIPLQEDLADWLNKLLSEYIYNSNFVFFSGTASNPLQLTSSVENNFSKDHTANELRFFLLLSQRA